MITDGKGTNRNHHLLPSQPIPHVLARKPVSERRPLPELRQHVHRTLFTVHSSHHHAGRRIRLRLRSTKEAARRPRSCRKEPEIEVLQTSITTLNVVLGRLPLEHD